MTDGGATTTPARPRLSRDYWMFWTASALSNIGDGIRLGALPLLAATVTREPIAVTIVVGLTMLPWAVFGPIGGALVDRLDRRRLIVWGQLGRGLAVALLAVMAALGDVPLAAIYVVAFVIGVGEVLVDTSSQAAIPLLAPPGRGGLELANARLASAQMVSEVAGTPVGALMFGAAAALPFGFDAATFLSGALLVTMVRAPLQTERSGTRTSVLTDVREGLRFLVGHDFLRSTAIAIGLMNVAFTAASSIFVLLVLEVFEAPDYAFGILIGAGAAGGFVGSFVATPVVRRIGRKAALVAPIAVSMALFALIGLSPNVAVATALFFASAFTSVIANVAGVSARQAVTPDRLLGRVVASYRMIGYGGVPLGAVLGGATASLFGIRSVFVLSAVIGGAATLLLARAVRHLPDDDQDRLDATTRGGSPRAA